MSRNSLTPRRAVSYGLRYLLLLAVLVIVLGPFLWMVTGSLKGNNEVLSFPPTFFPDVLRFDNYVEVFRYQPFANQFVNSIVVLVAVVAITLVVSTMAGYAFARVRIPGASIIFLVLLMGIYIPAESTLVPLYRMAASFGWIDTLIPLILIPALASPIATFVMRQAFLALPGEFGEAATLDGAGRWRILLQIYVPMVRPALAATTVLTAFYTWNAFLYPLIFLRTRENFTVPLGIAQYEDAYSGPLWSIQLAAATLSVIPVVIVFLVAQKQIISGMTAGGIK
jgi:multiple sugar transport system permease protein